MRLGSRFHHLIRKKQNNINSVKQTQRNLYLLALVWWEGLLTNLCKLYLEHTRRPKEPWSRKPAHSCLTLTVTYCACTAKSPSRHSCMHFDTLLEWLVWQKSKTGLYLSNHFADWSDGERLGRMALVGYKHLRDISCNPECTTNITCLFWDEPQDKGWLYSRESFLDQS